MGTFYFCVCLFAVLLQSTVSEYNPAVCTFPKESNGLIPPPLPTNFELKGEIMDSLNKSIAYHEMYFDYTNSQGKYMFIQKGIEHHFLYDYNTYQIVMWDILHPGLDMKHDPLSQVCVAENMEDSRYSAIFGYQDWSGSKPKMYNSNQVLRYGGLYPVAANGSGTLTDRGLHVNKFISCAYDMSIDTTLFANFSFTADNIEPSGATEVKDILGSEDGYLSIPVRIQYIGEEPDGKGAKMPLNRTLSISWFKGEPEFKVGTFQIPPFVYCKDYRGKKEMKRLPTAFSTRLVITQFMMDTLGNMQPFDSEGYKEIYYYGEKRLAREDFTIIPPVHTELYEQLQSSARVSVIDDFNTGLRYAISKSTGRCFINPIPESSDFDTHEPLIYRKMASPEEVFLMQTDEMEYKGKAFARDIECDVWTGKYFDKNMNATFVKETYVSTNGWHEEADDFVTYGVPVKHFVIRNELDGVTMEGVGAYNFLKFKPKPPRLSVFSIKSCLEHITHKTYAIKLSVSDHIYSIIFKYRWQFQETAQYYLTDIAQVLTPLRIQRVHLRRQSLSNNTPFLVFSVLDKVDFRGVAIVQRGADFQDAIDNLQRWVDASRFAVEFFPPGSSDAVIITAKAGDMYFVNPSGTLSSEPKEKKVEERSIQEENLVMRASKNKNSEKRKEVEVKGMSPGGLALLAFAMFFIGIGIGIAVMYLYLRMYSDGSIEEKIDMPSRP